MKRVILIGLIGILMAGLLCGSASAALAGGGTQSNPWQIGSDSDLRELSGTGLSRYLDTSHRYFALTKSFSMSSTSFTPIGTSSVPFNGVFDGRGYTITGLKISVVGALFLHVTSGAEIKNINIQSADVSAPTGVSNTVGILCYQIISATNTVTISNINIYDSKVTSGGGDGCGSILAIGAREKSNAKITSCNVERTIFTNPTYGTIGGIAGYCTFSNSVMEISSCNVNECVVFAQGYSAGGITGLGCRRSTDRTTITGCTVSNSIIITKSQVGGICAVGCNDSGGNLIIDSCEVENCYIHLNEEYRGGGIVGNTKSYMTITNCNVKKSTISATSYGNIGGIYGTYSGEQPLVSKCAVIDCTIIAGNSIAGGISGGT